MTQSVQTPPYNLGPDEKAARVLVYTGGAIFRGEVVVKQFVRVSTWLRTNSAPDWICLYNAKELPLATGTLNQPTGFSEMFIAVSQILAFHLLPPAKDPIDYDPSEPNRRMQPVTILVANFRMDGAIRLATHTSLGRFLEVNRETFVPVYDAKISNSLLPGLGTIQVPYLLVRQEASVFASNLPI